MAFLEFGYFKEALQRTEHARDKVDRSNGGLCDRHLAFGDKLRQTCIAYQRAHRDCTVVIGAVGYKTFEWKERNGHVLEGVFDKRKPFVMLDQGL